MIALDLDNTIICYDAAFCAAAEANNCVPPAGLPVTKATVKAAAFASGGNELWTKVQGLAYGTGIDHAKPYPGVLSFFNRALELEQKLVILSHKTEFPAIGPKVNLRTAALDWLKKTHLNIPVVFADTREGKVQLLMSLECEAIVDDLPAVFQTPVFPAFTQFILFDPTDEHPRWTHSQRARSWDDVSALLLPIRK